LIKFHRTTIDIIEGHQDNTIEISGTKDQREMARSMVLAALEGGLKALALGNFPGFMVSNW